MQETWKRPILIGVNARLLDQAEELGLDVAEITQRALERAVDAKSRQSERMKVTVHGTAGQTLRSAPSNASS